jgi:hypothetical protein
MASSVTLLARYLKSELASAPRRVRLAVCPTAAPVQTKSEIHADARNLRDVEHQTNVWIRISSPDTLAIEKSTHVQFMAAH